MKTNQPLRSLSSWMIPLLIFTVTQSAHAQISYLQFGNNNTETLRQVNPDGSGDTPISVPFSSFVYPAWSRDTTQFALTAAVPNRVSLNVFAINAGTGTPQNVTNFNDSVNGQNHSYGFAFFKAFSPDGSRMAVNSYFVSGGSQTADTYTPILQIFSSTGSGLQHTVLANPQLDGTHHGGQGVDWSPVADVLAAPAETDTPLQSGGGKGETTAIFLTQPNDNPTFHQLTFPHADQVASPTNGYVYGEHDYQPKFSPNGAAVAYVRSLQVAYYSNNYVPSPYTQSLRIVNLNTGADTQVVQFQQGLYVSSVDWSPDGTQLVFDLGQQATNNGFPAHAAVPSTDEIYVVGVDGNGLHKLRSAPSGMPAWKPSPTAPIVFGNIATRLRVGSGDNAMIGGFIITGNQPKKVLIRGMGPSLANVGVQGAMTDPLLELHQGDPVIATNDNWQQASNTNEIPNGFTPSDPRESVIVTTLQPGNYTAILKGAHGETGIGIVEVYDLTQNATTKFGNISTRGFVDTGDNTMFGGFIINGGNAKVMVRAMGPSLQKVGISNALQDPTLDLYNANGVVLQSNDNWQQASNTNEIPNGFSPSDPRESVIVTTLAPGNYSAIVRGKDNTTGIAIVEAYNLQ